VKQFLLIFIGGGLGSVFRFALGKIIPPSKTGFPWSTLGANLLGCLLIGLLLGWALKNNLLKSDLILFATVGFCGGLTTFSSFGAESLSLLKNGLALQFLSYILFSLLGGILMIALGNLLFRSLS